MSVSLNHQIQATPVYGSPHLVALVPGAPDLSR
jgi:hypothetical protein